MSTEEFLRLWPGDAPGAKGSAPEDIPAVQVFSPAEGQGRGAGMIVCPGGGYHQRMHYEGPPVAEWLALHGIAGFVLRYRVGPRYHHPAQMDDIQRALRFVRAHAADWKLDPARIGVLGFSAGGHLASTASTHYAAGDAVSADPVERVSSRPALQVLLYPVINAASHAGSLENLLGKNPDPQFIELLSNQKHVTRETPPAFLYHSTEDKTVPVSDSDCYAAALKAAGVPYSYIRGAFGNHGGGVNDNWAPQCVAWLKQNGF